MVDKGMAFDLATHLPHTGVVTSTSRATHIMAKAKETFFKEPEEPYGTMVDEKKEKVDPTLSSKYVFKAPRMAGSA